MFGKHGHGWGELKWPSVVTNNLVCVSDDHVSVFTSESQFVVSFGREEQSFNLLMVYEEVVSSWPSNTSNTGPLMCPH